VGPRKVSALLIATQHVREGKVEKKSEASGLKQRRRKTDSFSVRMENRSAIRDEDDWTG